MNQVFTQVCCGSIIITKLRNVIVFELVDQMDSMVVLVFVGMYRRHVHAHRAIQFSGQNDWDAFSFWLQKVWTN